MSTITATEAARRLSSVLDAARRGATFEIVRGGEHVATIGPPIRPNGSAVIDAYAQRTGDPAFADAVEEAHTLANTPARTEDPWVDD